MQVSRSLLSACAIAIISVVTCAPASAATLLFDFDADGSGADLLFTLDSSPVPDVVYDDWFEIHDIENQLTGTSFTAEFYNANGDGGFDTNGYSGSVFFNTGPQLFTGPLSSPTFLTGTFDLRLGTVVITDMDSAVPEPSTWAMMLLGFGFVGGAMRSAKRKQKLTVSYA